MKIAYPNLNVLNQGAIVGITQEYFVILCFFYYLFLFTPYLPLTKKNEQ